jgi:hypothetical protein
MKHAHDIIVAGRWPVFVYARELRICQQVQLVTIAHFFEQYGYSGRAKKPTVVVHFSNEENVNS